MIADNYQAPSKTGSEGIRFAVRLTPRGGRDAVEGWQTDSAGREYLKARVRAPADAGKANVALVELLAKWLDVPRALIAIRRGEKARLKIITVQGDPKYLTARVERDRIEKDGKKN